MDTNVLIVGAGPAGLTLAVILAEFGVDFRIVDRKPGPVSESRAALVHARTLELLDRLGLAERFVARGVKTSNVEIFERGRRAGGFPLAGDALGIEQGHTERLLVERLGELGRGVEWGVELADPVPGAARWVVGADGARSSVRRAVHIGFSGHTYSQTGMLADVELDLPEAIPDGTLRLNLTRGGFVGIFRLETGLYRLFGAVPPGFAPAAEAGDGVSHEAYSAIPVVDIQRWFDDYFGVRARILSAKWTALFRIHSRIAERFRSGSTFLVGDAAHIHSPAGGQGMNLAIGDAFNLGWKLALVARGQAHERLLDSYAAERRPVAETVLRWADRGFAWETTANPVAAWAREHIATRLVGPLTRVPAVRAQVFKLFSQTWIRYGDGPAVVGASAGAGVRVPESISDLRHHVYAPASARAEVLLDRYRVGFRVHDASDSRVTLVRPDGHVGYAGSGLDRLEAYLDGLYSR